MLWQFLIILGCSCRLGGENIVSTRIHLTFCQISNRKFDKAKRSKIGYLAAVTASVISFGLFLINADYGRCSPKTQQITPIKQKTSTSN